MTNFGPNNVVIFSSVLVQNLIVFIFFEFFLKKSFFISLFSKINTNIFEDIGNINTDYNYIKEINLKENKKIIDKINYFKYFDVR